jgi:hypothetical protein
MRTLLNEGAQCQCTKRQTAKERRNNGQHCCRFVTQPDSALLRPDNLVAQGRKAGCTHQRQGNALARGYRPHGHSVGHVSRQT